MELSTENTLSKRPRKLRTRLFPSQVLPPEEIARRKAERAEFGARCRVVFEKLRPQLIEQYYNWFIAVGPDSENYLIAPSLEGLIEQGRQKPSGSLRERHSDGKRTIFRLNETGVCGRI